MKHALPQLDFKRVAVEFDNLILTKYHGLKIVFETAEFENPHTSHPTHAPHQISWRSAKMMVAGLYADKAVNVGFDNISLDKTETDIIAQIDFAMKREGYEMSFDTMVLTGDNAANPHGIPAANKVENNALLLFDLGVLVNGYASDMTRTVAVGKPDQFKKIFITELLEAQQAALWLYQTRCDCPWSGPRCPWGHRKSWLRRVLQPPSWSRYRYGCPRIPIYHGRKRHGHRRRHVLLCWTRYLYPW